MTAQVHDFQKIISDYYGAHARQLPWREPEPDGSFDAYKILVSELMLQQTQVSRVIPKFQEFLKIFPTLKSLADAKLGQVLKVWSGLGYNRRAKYLHQAAHHLIPKTWSWKYEDLIGCSGIGPNTAGAILAYAYNQPALFIETNIRTVYIHHFFSGQNAVDDKHIEQLITKTMNHQNPRQFYWAIMDYGTYLKSTVGNVNRASKAYAKQSRYPGSRRQVRGQVIRLLTAHDYGAKEIALLIPDERLQAVLDNLKSEGLIVLTRSRYRLA